MNAQYINLDMTPSGVLPVLYCSQYDIGRPLGMVVYNRGEAVNLDIYTCVIEATRTDGTAVMVGVTTDGNICAFTTTATMTNQADKYPAKLVVTDGSGNRIASLAFVLCVTPKTMDENAESIREDESLFQQYTGTVQTIIAEIRSDLAAETARATAAETSLQSSLAAETSARQAADQTLTGNIASEASARQEAVASLQSEIASESAARSASDISLQSQIDQLVAPTGTAPSAAEVENARIGSEGMVYSTLGDAIRAPIKDLKTQVYTYDAPSTDTFTIIKGGLSSTGANLDGATYLASRRREQSYIPYASGSVITCDSAYDMAIYFYSGATVSTYISNTGYIGSKFEVPYVAGAKYIRLVMKRVDGQNFGDSEIPTVTYIKATSNIMINAEDIAALESLGLAMRTYTSTDFNDYTENGAVILGYSTDYIHAPNSQHGYRTIITLSQNGVMMQIHINRTAQTVHTRTYAGSTFGEWSDLMASDYFKAVPISGTDMDAYLTNGFTVLAYSAVYTHAPNEKTGHRLLLVYSQSGVTWQVWINRTRKEYYTRVYAAGAWGAWASMMPETLAYNESQNATIFDPTYTQNTLAADIPDSKVRVLSYNVAQYDNDGTTHIGDSGKEDTLIHFKQMLMTVGADIVCTQEDQAYIDSADTLEPLPCLFSPLYPYKLGVGGPAMYYRKAGTVQNFSLDTVTVRRGIVTVGTKSLYVYTAHLSVSSVANRQTQIQDILQNAIGAENPTHWVFCGDFNSIEAEDRTYLTTLASTNGYTLANGGYLGWINTNRVKLPLDNFLCSPKVVIAKFEVLGNWSGDLWSDHYPVYCDLVLRD